jgi:serine/threonine protein kinase
MAADLHALPNGYTLQEYRIEAMIGAGGFGLTYLAHDGNLNTKVAIKEYLPADFALRSEDQTVQPKSSAAQPTFEWGLKRFLDESRTLASFRHPNIVRVMRFFQANQTAYMVMEFIAGKSLNEWVKTHGTLDEAGLVAIALPLLDGLEAIHKAGYLHRDIKPPNIYMREDGAPVLIDFGSARMNLDPNKDLTSIVSPGFAPLEQYHASGKQGPWTDLYSFGGVLYWLVTGQKPVEAVGRVREDTQPAAMAVGDRKLYGEEFLAAVDWSLKPNEQERPQTVAEFRAVLARGRAAAPGASRVPATSLGAVQPVAPASTPVSTPNSTTSNVLFDKDWLKRVEQEVAAHIGPIATVVVKNAARQAAGVPALIEALATELPEGEARTRFMRKYAGDAATEPPHEQTQLIGGLTSLTALSGEPLGATVLQRFSAEVLRRAETALAQHIGAIARIVVKRAAQKARDERELYLLLGDEIADKEARKAFVRQVLAGGKT